MITVTVSNDDANQLVRMKRDRNRLAQMRRKIAKRKAEPQERHMRGNRQASVSTVPPKGADLVLLARAQITIGNKIFPRGSVLEVADLTNLQALLDSRLIGWGKRPVVAAPKPRRLPAPEKVRARPAVEIVPDQDTIQSWRKTRARMIELCDGNASLAADLLMQSPDSSALFLLATKLACERERVERKLISCGPYDLRERLL